MYRTTRRYATAFALSAALLVAGCSSTDEMAPTAAQPEEEVFLQPVAEAGPDPFTDSTSKVPRSRPPVTRTPQPEPTGTATTQQGVRSVHGGTPGLYGGTQNAASCDVDAQIRFLTANRSKEKVFAETVGVAPDDVPRYLRGLTAVQLLADTRVTNHGFRDGRANAYQSVLQAGTAVLVDNRGMPRVRCSCGNPLTPPAALKSNPTRHGKPWSGFQPTKVVVVTPAPTVITNITIINITNNTWIERPTGHKGKDKVVPEPEPKSSPTSPPPSSPSPSESCPTVPPPADEDGREPTLPPGCPTPTPADCPSVLPPSDPDGREPTLPPGCPTPPEAETDGPTEPGPDENVVPDDQTGAPDQQPDQGVPDEVTEEVVPDAPTDDVMPEQQPDPEQPAPDEMLPSLPPSQPEVFNG